MAAIQARIRFLEQRIQMLMMQAMQGDNGALKEIKKLQSELEGLYQRLEQLQKQEEARPGAAGAQSQRHFGLGSSPGGSGPGSSAFEGGGRGGGGGSRPPNVPSGWLLGRPNLGYGQPAGGGAGGAGGGAVVLGGDNEWYPFPDEDA